MSTERTFTLPLPARNNRYYRHARGVTYLSKEGRDYKRQVAELLDGMTPLEGDVCLSARVYRARNAGDLDGFQKGVLDALEGLAFNNDAQVVAMHWYKDLDRKAPRVEVKIWEATER